MLFSVVLFVAHVFIGALIPSFEEYEDPSARAFWFAAEYLMQAALVIAIFARLARIQARLLYVHAICVVVLCELLGFAVMFTFVGHVMTSTLMMTALDYSVLAVSTIVGTEIGRKIREARIGSY